MLRPVPVESLTSAAESVIAVLAPAYPAEGGLPLFEAIPCISMVAGPGDGTSVLAIFWDRHSERLGKEGFMRHFTTREARVLRQICREFRETVDATFWNDLETRISGSLEDWHASFPNAIAANLSLRTDLVDDDFALFRGFHALDISQRHQHQPLLFTEAAFFHMRGIQKLFMRYCSRAAITDAIFANLRGIEELDMRGCDQAAITSAGFEQLRGIEVLGVDAPKHPLCAVVAERKNPGAIRLIDEGDTMWINATVFAEKWSPLHFASYHGSDAVILRLLELGANVNAAMDDGRSPLHVACFHDRHSTARLLLQWGAEIEQRDSNGLTPLQSTYTHALKALLRSLGATR